MPARRRLHPQGVKVRPGCPPVLPACCPRRTSADRLDLAKWLVDPANPLDGAGGGQPRWRQFFGLAIVETENDFGTQGTAAVAPGVARLAGERVRRAAGGR